MNAEPIRDITLGSKLILSGRAAAEGRASSIRTGLKKKELARVRRGAYIILTISPVWGETTATAFVCSPRCRLGVHP